MIDTLARWSRTDGDLLSSPGRGLKAGRPLTEVAAEIEDRVETVLRFYAQQAATQRTE